MPEIRLCIQFDGKPFKNESARNAKNTRKGKSADAVFAKAEQIGTPVTDEGFKAFVKKVADGR